MNAKTIKGLNEAEGHIEIDINGLSPKVSCKINNSEALLISISALISSMAKLADVSDQEVLLAIVEFFKETRTYTADSQEQADVMKEILKRGEKIDDSM